MDQGPVLVISFVTEQIVYVEDARGNLVEGNKVSDLFQTQVPAVVLSV